MVFGIVVCNIVLYVLVVVDFGFMVLNLLWCYCFIYCIMCLVWDLVIVVSGKFFIGLCGFNIIKKFGNLGIVMVWWVCGLFCYILLILMLLWLVSCIGWKNVWELNFVVSMMMFILCNILLLVMMFWCLMWLILVVINLMLLCWIVW